MGMYRWQPNMIRFMEDASNHSDYFQNLAAYVEAWCRKGDNICDVGCGLGQLSLQLAMDGFNVAALDLNQTIIRRLRVKAAAVAKLSVICADAFCYQPPEPYDAAVFCSFGSAEEIIFLAKRFGCKQAIVIKRTDNRHRFSIQPSYSKRPAYHDMLDEFRRGGYSVESVETVLHLDQPFRTIEDALDFFNTYSFSEYVVKKEDVLPRLTERDYGEFRYILPVENKLGIVRLMLE